MKKVMIMTFLLLMIAQTAEARTVIKIPDFTNPDTFKQLKNGTYKVGDIQFGQTKQNIKEKLGQPDYNVQHIRKYYDNLWVYEVNSSSIEFLFEGKSGQTIKQYPLREINFAWPDIEMSVADMRALYGKEDFYYRSGYQRCYMYGHMVFMYTKYDNWQLTNIWYAGSHEINKKKQDYRK